MGFHMASLQRDYAFYSISLCDRATLAGLCSVAGGLSYDARYRPMFPADDMT